MAYHDRQTIINRIEAIRGTKLLTYVITTRPGINTMIEPDDLRVIFDHLNSAALNNKKIDLFIYSNGGVSTTAWALCNLIRSHSTKFSIIIPYNAFSCATSIALGADDIVMGKMGTLGPIDPTVANEFNPIINNRPVGISVEDISGFWGLITDKFKIHWSHNRVKLFEKLATDIRPLALGNAYRHYLKARDDAGKLLSLHMDPKKDKNKINSIISILVEKLYYHGHHINRIEAKEIGLAVKNAEDVSPEYAILIWNLFKDYESELKLRTPYQDELPAAGAIQKVPIKFIESTVTSNRKVIEQNWESTNTPTGSRLITNNGQACIYLPTGTVLPVIFKGSPATMNGVIYDKQEVNYWE